MPEPRITVSRCLEVHQCPRAWEGRKIRFSSFYYARGSPAVEGAREKVRRVEDPLRNIIVRLAILCESYMLLRVDSIVGMKSPY